MTADLRASLQDHLGAAYTIERELGGGMSRVFVALEHRLARRVAIKVLPPTLAATVSVERFNREIMLAAGLQHPNVVPVLHAGELAGLPYFVMPFVAGESLRTRIARGPLSVRETVSVMKDVARALAAAHAQGVVHRDVKPDNVLLASGTAVVTDFGVAKAISAARGRDARAERAERAARAGDGTITEIGFSLGTPSYMAPEQVAADPAVDHRADLYAFGVVAYEMLVGTPPFHGRPPQAILAAQVSEAPPPLAARRYDVPVALAALVMQCLEKEPAHRPRSAADIARLLDSPAVVTGTFAVPPNATRRRLRRVARNALGVAVLLLGAVGFVRWWRDAPVPVEDATTSPASLLAPAAGGRSVAVLPFAAAGGGPREAGVALGLASDLANALGDLPGLRVAARAPAVGASSSAATWLVEGVAQRVGERLRVTVRLVDAARDSTLWRDRVDGPMADALSLQDTVSARVVAAVRTRLVGAP